MQEHEKEQPQGSEYRLDGYKNLLNKYGTKKDASEQYRFESDGTVDDTELTLHYEENGLFAKIIDLPADDAVSSGFSFGMNHADMKNFISNSLEELDFEEKAATALKWSRLYGGALMVVLVDDGGDLTDPVDWDAIRGVDELIVFEKPLVQPDYHSIYSYKPNQNGVSKFGRPEFYDIYPPYGSSFRVHESRCLIFRNGVLPAKSIRQEYRFFGIPEYVRIHKALQETVTAHGNGVRLLDRAVQAIYKMQDLEELLSTPQGEDAVLRRLEIIDMAKGILNSIVIDAKGEDYDFKSISFAGIKDIMDSTCNMLSAVTDIPQTKLFGRSPAGENATGESDMENYYKFVGRIQKLNLKGNLRTLIDMILAAGAAKGEFEEIPEYKLQFNPLWSLSEAEQAAVDQAKAAAELTKAQTAQIYVDMQALDASEVRKGLAENSAFAVHDVSEEEEMDWNEMTALADYVESEETKDTALSAVERLDDRWITTKQGRHILISESGRVLKGHPNSMGNTAEAGKGKNNKNAEKSSKNQEKELQKSEKNGNIVSAKGTNSLKVKGFKNKQHLNNHWQNGRTHKGEYAKDGITTKEQYAKRAVELAEMPVGGNILGYKTSEGYICRYDKEKNDYVKADIEKGVRTMFKPDKGEVYYQEMLKKEGVDNE